MADQLPSKERDDHDRGCQGRQYTCTCGYDVEVDARLKQYIARCVALEQELSHYRHVAQREIDAGRTVPEPGPTHQITSAGSGPDVS